MNKPIEFFVVRFCVYLSGPPLTAQNAAVPGYTVRIAQSVRPLFRETIFVFIDFSGRFVSVAAAPPLHQMKRSWYNDLVRMLIKIDRKRPVRIPEYDNKIIWRSFTLAAQGTLEIYFVMRKCKRSFQPLAHACTIDGSRIVLFARIHIACARQ